MTTPCILISLAEKTEEPCYILRTAYSESIYKAGGLPMAGFPFFDDPDSVSLLLDRVDAVLLSGGTDVSPLLMEEEPAPGIGEVFPMRDRFELAMAKEALKRGMPVLGICRGMQILGLVSGGTVIQDINSVDRPDPVQHRQTAAWKWEWHSVKVRPESRLATMLGSRIREGRLNVNSSHHQSVGEVPDGWLVSAVATDGVNEALELEGLDFVVGVQWHPEHLPQHAPLFEAFVAAARDYRDRSDNVG